MEKKKSILAKIFNIVAFVASALILPVKFYKAKKKSFLSKLTPWRAGGSWPKMALMGLVYGVLQPLATYMLPTAEEVLKKEGLDPKIAETLAPGKTIYVREANILGGMHAFFDQPLITQLVSNNLSYWRSAVAGYANPGNKVFFRDMPVIRLKSEVIYKKEALDARKAVERVTEGAYTYIEVLGIKDKKDLTLLHEIRHCAEDNQNLETVLEKEADADALAFSTLAIARDAASMMEAVISERALQKTVTHNTILYLDAIFNSKAVPAGDEMAKANEEALPAMDSLFRQKLMRMSDVCGKSIKTFTICDYACDSVSLSPLARRRVALYEQWLEKGFVRKPAPKTGV